MLEITGADIALLNDEDLRSLVGLLCESEARTRGFSASTVTWGGNQNAKDGGLDVRVALPPDAKTDGFVPRPATGFQSKASDMARNEILAEMCPRGILRPVIRELAHRAGAYVIVSSKGSTSDLALTNRHAAMREAVADLPNSSALILEFYDRGRLATWLRDHAGLIPWVRQKIGRSVPGWRSYGAWAFDPDGAKGQYLLDETVRVVTKADREGTPELRVLDGLERIRELLRNPRSVVRLVGLSGVGKTRFVQALFDERVGNHSLEPTIAYYADPADEPDPTPTTFAADLIAARQRAFLIVDNCPPELHQRLSEICRSPESSLSLLTIEYDIRDDQPEGTDVYSLEPSSVELMDKLVKRRFPELSSVDSRTIAEFSGGNARIALVLAGTIGKNETIAGLSDENLFKRLFQQRNEPNESLYMAAQALSLVYSFQGQDVSRGKEAELYGLGGVIAKNAQEMFQCAAELERRGLLQKRGVWRAVLPQAIANRLAALALQNIPATSIDEWFASVATEHAQKSFSHRLGYLGNSKEAQAIATRWLAPSGLLKDIAEFDEGKKAIFNYIAPIVPQEVLSALERALFKADDADAVAKFKRHIYLLRSLAYDATLFERSVALIVKIIEVGDVNDDSAEAANVFSSLFRIQYSGTHATINQRLAVIKPLLLSENIQKRGLGSMALKSALETSYFGVGYSFEFGARSRDYGYWPTTRESVRDWFGQVLSFASAIACTDAPSARRVRRVIGDQFRGLWTNAAIYDDLERLCKNISEKHFWAEGWIAVRQTMYYDSNGLPPEISARLASLELLLRPQDLEQKVRTMVLSEAVIYIGFDAIRDESQDVAKTMAEVEVLAQDLGRAAALDNQALTALLPDLIAGNSQPLWSFGGGLADGTEDPRAIWNRMVLAMKGMPAQKRNVQMFRGFLNRLNETDPILTNQLLDDAMELEPLAQWYPVLQTAAMTDERAVKRLMRSLAVGKAGIETYRQLVAGGVSHGIAGRDFNSLLQRIAGKDGGWDVAVEILCMRLAFEEGRRMSSTAEIIDIGCELMRQVTFTNRKSSNTDHKLRIIGKHSLIGEKGATTVREICRNLKAAISKSETYAFYQDNLLQTLLGNQPVAALEALCGGGIEDFNFGMSILEGAGQLQRNPFDAVPEGDLLAWCDELPEIRYPGVAGAVTAFRVSGNPGRPQWSSTGLRLLERAPDRVAVLKKLVRQFAPSAWAGSYAAIVESNARLLNDLTDYSDPKVVEFVRMEKARLAEAIKSERHAETLEERARDERFE